jgi:hypothetical protein
MFKATSADLFVFVTIQTIYVSWGRECTYEVHLR